MHSVEDSKDGLVVEGAYGTGLEDVGLVELLVTVLVILILLSTTVAFTIFLYR